MAPFALGESKLLVALLHRALADAVGADRFHERHVRSARQWIFLWTESDRLKEWSFPWVCEHLLLDPALLRDQVLDKKNAGALKITSQAFENLLQSVLERNTETYGLSSSKRRDPGEFSR